MRRLHFLRAAASEACVAAFLLSAIACAFHAFSGQPERMLLAGAGALLAGVAAILFDL